MIHPLFSRRDVLRATGAFIGAATAPLAFGQKPFPDRPVSLVVPFGAGGPTDVIARTIAQAMSSHIGQPVVVDNVAGAGGNIGVAKVTRSNADGHTMLFISTTMTINPTLYPKAGYSLSDLKMVGLIGESPLWLCVSAESKYKTLGELVDAMRKSPGDITFASGGTGTTSHLGVEMFRRRFGLDAKHIPYRASATLFPDLIAGRVDFFLWPVAGTEQFVQSGKLRALAVTGESPLEGFPQIPTFAKAGFPGVDVVGWFGLAVPRGTPAPVKAMLEKALATTLNDSAVRTKLASMGTTARVAGQQDFTRYVQAEAKRWSELVRLTGAQVE